MTVPSYTEEDVELVARVLNGKSLFDEPAASSIILDPLRESYREQARAILAALSSAGRLVPPGSECRCRRCEVGLPGRGEYVLGEWAGCPVHDPALGGQLDALKPCSFLEHGGCYDGPCQVELTRPGCHVAGLSEGQE